MGHHHHRRRRRDWFKNFSLAMEERQHRMVHAFTRLINRWFYRRTSREVLANGAVRKKVRISGHRPVFNYHVTNAHFLQRPWIIIAALLFLLAIIFGESWLNRRMETKMMTRIDTAAMERVEKPPSRD